MSHEKEELIQFVARALAEAEGDDPDGTTEDGSIGRGVPMWERYRRIAARHIVATDAIVRFAMTRVDTEERASLDLDPNGIGAAGREQ